MKDTALSMTSASSSLPGVPPEQVAFRLAGARLKTVEARARVRRFLEQGGELPFSAHDVEVAKSDLERYHANDVSFILWGSSGYPTLLARIFDPPLILFVRGNSDALESGGVRLGIVGSRNADPHGLGFARELGRELSSRGGCVVSGLAYGIDAAAHRGTLDELGGIPTVAVLGNGLERVYPAKHTDLARQIIERGGAVVSQFELGIPPLPHNFLNRNRVIAGLSEGVVVVQAAQRSGSLVTAHFANGEGRDVYAVPGSVTDPRHAGCHTIIKQGAGLITSIDDLILAYPCLGARMTADAASTREMPMESLPILKALGDCSPRSLEEILALVAAPEMAHLLLLKLELEEIIVRIPGNRVSRGPKFVTCVGKDGKKGPTIT